ncbi:glycosyltransferase [Pedobacter frigiditerrae]|uniref:Glycosyltransferase n=1 Tax=Pedobacter frigiditerrae TaxID=2530452 RepID=A0A4R0MZ54_9SPHI|nr:glycosyltransferase family 2 protein [Pedobacter frigiditerrae]TCC92237.1 glycosyltransferase [Pedobacter frigiditerrae]
MKVSLITVVYNAEKYIKDCVESIISQTYPNIEYIVIDGASTDGTLPIIDSYRNRITHFVSEKDKGIYDAINKGISISTGEIIGVLNADDMLTSAEVIAKIVKCFESLRPDAVYGNLNYVDAENTGKISRKWLSKQFEKKDIEMGWMPAHPTFYAKRELFEKYGGYSLDFGTAADYELMIRFLYRYQINAKFLDQLIVNMRVGGVSNNSFKQRYLALKNDYKAIKENKISLPLITLLFKKLSKIPQYLRS